MDLTEVKGIGPATAIKLTGAAIKTAEQLASKDPEQLTILGIGLSIAKKIIANAKELVGAVEEPVKEIKAKKKKEVKPKKEIKAKKKKEVKPVKKEEDVKTVIPEGELSLDEVKGVGPKIKTSLEDSGISTTEQLAKATVDNLVNFGIGKATAIKIIDNANEILGIEPEPLEEVKEKPKAKPKKKKSKKKEEDHIVSPMPQGIPTKKKRGLQIKAKIEDEDKVVKPLEKPVGWGVKAKRLTKEELEARKKRQDEIARSRKITRKIPITLAVVKAIKPKKAKVKGEKPEKLEKKAKKARKAVKKKVISVEYYTQQDIYQIPSGSKKRSVVGKSGTKKPRIELERDTYLGMISSHRRSRRVVHNRQVIVDLDKNFNPDQLVGQKVYFVYPDSDLRVAGSVSKRFGKTTSRKVLVNFKKGIRMEGMYQKLFIK